MFTILSVTPPTLSTDPTVPSLPPPSFMKSPFFFDAIFSSSFSLISFFLRVQVIPLSKPSNKVNVTLCLYRRAMHVYASQHIYAQTSVIDGHHYRVAKTPRMHYLNKSFSAKKPYN